MFSAIFRKFNDFYDIYFFFVHMYRYFNVITFYSKIRFSILLVTLNFDESESACWQRMWQSWGWNDNSDTFFRKWTRLKNILKFPLFYFFVLAHWKKNTRYIIFNRREFIAWNFRYLLIFNILHSKIWNQIFTDSLLTFSRYYLYVVNLIVFS